MIQHCEINKLAIRMIKLLGVAMLLKARNGFSQMASKKGIIITVAILAVIAGASFVVWLIPQNRGSSFIVSDYKNELDSIKERHSIIIAEMSSSFKGLLDKTLSSDDFISQAQASSSQVTSLISETLESNPPIEWKQSYISYYESLKKYNDYLTETIILASKMKGGISSLDLKDELSKLDVIKKESDSFATKSGQTRP
jgi:hypothetical protein